MLMIRRAVCACVDVTTYAHLNAALIDVIRRNLMIEQYQSVYDIFTPKRAENMRARVVSFFLFINSKILIYILIFKQILTGMHTEQ